MRRPSYFVLAANGLSTLRTARGAFVLSIKN